MISLLSDKVLGSVERYINPELTLEQLCTYIRRAEGWDQDNAESFASELRHRRRARNESIVDFYSELHRIGDRAYPREAQENIRNAVIRESFLANLGHPQLSARLREHPEIGLEDLLSLAIHLNHCMETSMPQTSLAQTAMANSLTTATGRLTGTVGGDQELREIAEQILKYQENSGQQLEQVTASLEDLMRDMETYNMQK